MITVATTLALVTYLSRKHVTVLLTHLGFYALCMATIAWRPDQAALLRHLHPEAAKRLNK